MEAKASPTVDKRIESVNEDGSRAGPASSSTARSLELDRHAERRLMAKIDFAICPIVCLIYMFCYIDRSNIGNARIAGLENDLNLHGYDFNIALTSFVVAYALFQSPAAICCKLLGPGWFLPGCTTAFGIAAVGTGLVTNRAQLIAVRFMLGIFEAGMLPGIAYYMSRWYCRAELAFRLSLYIATAPLAGAFGGLLASAILKLSSFGGLHGWRMIFAIEGIVTIALGVLAFFFLTDRPETARWLTPEERRLAAHRVTAERVTTTELLDKIDRVKLWRGISNPVVLGTAVTFLLNACTVQGLGYFLPTIVSNIFPDASTTQQQLYTVPPYILGVFLTLLASGISWWLDRRQIIMILSAVPVITAYALFLGSLNSYIRYAATFLIGSTSFIMGNMTNAQVSANVVSDTTRSAAIGANVQISALGAILATWAFLPFDAPYYAIGNGLNLATSSTWFLIGIGTWVWMLHDNKRRGLRVTEEELAGLSQKEIEDLDWKHPAFRWRP